MPALPAISLSALAGIVTSTNAPLLEERAAEVLALSDLSMSVRRLSFRPQMTTAMAQEEAGAEERLQHCTGGVSASVVPAGQIGIRYRGRRVHR